MCRYWQKYQFCPAVPRRRFAGGAFQAVAVGIKLTAFPLPIPDL